MLLRRALRKHSASSPLERAKVEEGGTIVATFVLTLTAGGRLLKSAAVFIFVAACVNTVGVAPSAPVLKADERRSLRSRTSKRDCRGTDRKTRMMICQAN